MTVTVRGIGSVRKYFTEKNSIVALAEGSTIADLKTAVGIPVNRPLGYVVNDIAVSMDYELKNNDSVSIVMLVGAG